MMDFSFFLVTSLCLIIFQTVIIPGSSWFPFCFDILIIPVLYLSLLFSRWGAVLGIVAIGVVKDSLSGVPFCIYMFSYLWVYLIVQLFKQFVFQRSAVFMMAVSLMGLSIQQGLILFSVFLSHGRAGLVTVDPNMIFHQIVWGTLVIPPGIWVLNILRQNITWAVKRLRREMARKYRG